MMLHCTILVLEYGVWAPVLCENLQCSVWGIARSVQCVVYHGISCSVFIVSDWFVLLCSVVIAVCIAVLLMLCDLSKVFSGAKLDSMVYAGKST